MAPSVLLREVGIRFSAPRKSRYGHVPRLIGARRRPIWGIRHVDLEVEAGELVGLIGPNGAGKTTLLRTVAGIYRPDEGTVNVSGRVAPMLSFEGDLKPGLSGWQNIELSGVLLGLSQRQVKESTEAIASFCGLGDFLDAKVRVYSTGMKARLGFAVAAFSEPDVLVLDEAMTVGDEAFKEKSLEIVAQLRSRGGAVMVASHEVEQLTQISDRLVRLEAGQVVEAGTPKEVSARYLRESHAKAHDSDHKNDLDRAPPIPDASSRME